METSHISKPELVPALSAETRPPSFKHAWRDGDEIFIDGLAIGNLNSEGLLLAAERAMPRGRTRRALQPGMPYLAGDLPATLYRFIDNEDRDAILIKILFASQRLAESRLRPVGRGGMRCQQCEAVFEPHGLMLHRPHCVAGQVLDLLDELRKMGESDPAPKGGAA